MLAFMGLVPVSISFFLMSSDVGRSSVIRGTIVEVLIASSYENPSLPTDVEF
jgi:hypothetical protein